MGRYGYLRWDGTQLGGAIDLDADDVLAHITDDVLYHGDLSPALRRLLQSGFRDRSGHHVPGLRELLERLRRRREELLQGQFHRMSAAMGDMTPERAQHMKDLFAALNELLELRAAGQDTTDAFGRFMERFGELFPGRPATLDELLEQLAARMAAAQDVINSLSPEQRAELQRLSDELLADMDLGWQVERLRANLQEAFPGAGWGRQFGFSGQDPLSLAGAAAVLDQLGAIDDLENLLRSAPSPGALADVDLDRARMLLGADDARALERLAQLSRSLEEAGLAEHRGGRLELTPRGLRRMGDNALTELFSRLARDRFGGHQVERAGAGHERAHESRPYQFGDPFELNIERTVRNAVARAGAGVPVRLSPDDFEVERTETLTRTSTVVMLDLSLSMPMRDNFLAAKKVVVALHALISSRFPRDYLGIVGFSEMAREIKPSQLPSVSWDFVFGTNLQHGLALARRLLAGHTGTRQIVLVTDGEPTAHVLPDGEVFFHYPPVRETVDATLAEVNRCTREGIRINTFMLDADRALTSFVEKLTELNRGRAFFTSPESLGEYVLVDFIEQRRATRASGRRRTS